MEWGWVHLSTFTPFLPTEVQIIHPSLVKIDDTDSTGKLVEHEDSVMLPENQTTQSVA